MKRRLLVLIIFTCTLTIHVTLSPELIAETLVKYKMNTINTDLKKKATSYLETLATSLESELKLKNMLCGKDSNCYGITININEFWIHRIALGSKSATRKMKHHMASSICVIDNDNTVVRELHVSSSRIFPTRSVQRIVSVHSDELINKLECLQLTDSE